MPPKGLLDLPPEVLISIASQLDSLPSYFALGSTCHYIHTSIATLPPPSLLQLTYGNPHWTACPLHLLVLLAPGIRAYASSSEARRVDTKRAMWEGKEAFLAWAISRPSIAVLAGFSARTLRNFRAEKEGLWDSVADLADRNVGAQWHEINDFWDGGRSDAYTIDAEPAEIPFQLALWGELFGSGWGEWLDAAGNAVDARKAPPAASVAQHEHTAWDPHYPPPTPWCSPSVRTDFLKYTFVGWRVSLSIRTPSRKQRTYHDDPEPDEPDAPNELDPPSLPSQSTIELDDVPPDEFDEFNDVFSPDTPLRQPREPRFTLYPPSSTDFFALRGITPFHHPLREVQARIGPYARREDESEERVADDQLTLSCLINGSMLWERVISRIRELCGGDFEAPHDGEPGWRQKMWNNCIYALGITGIRMIRDVWESMRPDEDDRERRRQLVMDMPRDQRPPEWGEEFRQWPLPVLELREEGDGWETMRKWRNMIARLDHAPRPIGDRSQETGYEFPHLLGDLNLILG